MSNLSVVIPAFNEALRLPATLDSLLAFRSACELSLDEIIVVDDGSTDRTVDIVKDYISRDPVVRLVRNPGNRGKGFAVRNGMLSATSDWILFSDADLSTPIAALSSLLKATQQHRAVIAFGSRALDHSMVKVRQSPLREMAGRTFNLILRLVVGLSYHDTQCGFKLFRADAAREVFRRQRLDGFSFDVEALVIARKLGFEAVEVPVEWHNAEGSKVTLLNGLRSFFELWTIRLNELHGYYDL